jgi:tetratricopeptide (TPR) repeat protein
MMYATVKMQAGDLQGARALLEEATLYTPNYPTLEENLGVVAGLLAAHGDTDDATMAEVHFRRAVALAPNDDTTHAYYGQWLLSQGRLDEAVAQLHAAVAQNGQSPFDRQLLVHAYTQQGDAPRAKQMAEEILRLDPENALALETLRGGDEKAELNGYINSSLALYQAGRFQEAIDEARKALRLDPRSAAAWNNIGAGYGALRQWDMAIDAEQHALVIDPGLQVARNNLQAYVTSRDAGR